jgi:hypothetical protein
MWKNGEEEEKKREKNGHQKQARERAREIFILSLYFTR